MKKRQRRLSDVDEIVLSMYAKGLTTGEISAHFAEIYGAQQGFDSLRITRVGLTGNVGHEVDFTLDLAKCRR